MKPSEASQKGAKGSLRSPYCTGGIHRAHASSCAVQILQEEFFSCWSHAAIRVQPEHTRAQLLLLEAEALYLVEIVASLLGRHVVGGHTRDRLVAGIVRGIEHQRALPRVHLPRITGSQASPAPG